MRIWIDALTPKQALFTQPLVEELAKLEHVVYVTSRHYREVEALLKKARFDVFFVGKHGGASLFDKLVASSERIRKLADLVARWEPELAIHFASPECARVAFGLRIPQVCITDSPHAESVMKLTLPFVDHLVTPWVVPYSAWKDYVIMRKNITRYEALDPAAWLKRKKPEKLDLGGLGADPNKRTITVRYEETYAAYMRETDVEWGEKILDALTSKFTDANLILLPRYEEQATHFSEKYQSKVIVPKEPINGAALLSSSDLFIGMGGTMTAEAALLGVPTISALQGRSLYFERYLIKEGLLVKGKTVEQILRAAETLLNDESTRKQISERAKRILEKMEDPVKDVISVAEKFKKP